MSIPRLGAASLAALVLLVPAVSAHAGTATFSGLVDAAGRSRIVHPITVDAAGTLRTRFDSAGTGTPGVALARRAASGAWVVVARAAGGRDLSVGVRPGRWRLQVEATRGAARWHLRADYPGPSARYLTLLFSRTAITDASACAADDRGVARLDTVVAPELARRGLAPTGTVQTGVITPQSGYSCIHQGGTLAASWDRLAALRDRFGWTFVSHSRDYHLALDLGSLTREEQRAQTCGSAADLRAHGHLRGDGLFAYPSNRLDERVQADVVARCFAFGRTYGEGTTRRTGALSPPHWQSTAQTGGGRCVDPTLACSRLESLAPYTAPAEIAGRIAATRPDEWFTLQGYVYVTGYMPGEWDCRSPDPRAHWSTDWERYCYKDLLAILDRIPSDMSVTDPKAVAQAWGRTAG